MKNLAPHIYRQRLCIEGIYTIDIKKTTLNNYLEQLSKLLKMSITFGPVVQNEAEKINPIHKGYEGIIMWAESGTHVYSWDNGKFFSVDIYSCKKYSNEETINFTKNFFKTTDIEFVVK